jgi:hypothetical protein
MENLNIVTYKQPCDIFEYTGEDDIMQTTPEDYHLIVTDWENSIISFTFKEFETYLIEKQLEIAESYNFKSLSDVVDSDLFPYLKILIIEKMKHGKNKGN